MNEGVAEWPISPWRVLRALAAGLHARGPELDREVAEATLRKLVVPPLFTLPPASLGHTRHYLSLNAVKRSETTLTMDVFVALDRREAIYIHWPVELLEGERRALSLMAGAISYLGRAESWCEMGLLGQDEDFPEPNCGPVEEAGFSGDTQPVRVLCPAEAMTQADLERTTSALQREGWNDPPGTRWVLYQRVGEAVAPQVRAPVTRRQAHRPVVAEFALGATVLPLFTEAVLVAEQIRAAALSRHGDPSEVLAGKDREGKPLRGQHRHAHYIPDARGSGKRVSHVLVYAPMGFSESEQAALAKVSFLSQRHNRPIVHVVLSGFGSSDDLRSATPLFGVSRRWRSRTPFVLTRHPRRGKETPADQVIRECRARGLAEPSEVTSVPGARLFDSMAGESGVTRWVEFVTARHGRRHPLGAYGFELVFAEPVRGPLFLGYGCHYGLGQFEALS